MGMRFHHRKFKQLAVVVGLGFVLFGFNNCGGPKVTASAFSSDSFCSSPSCASVASQSIRITTDSSALMKKIDKQFNIGGVCNQGDAVYNEIQFKLTRSNVDFAQPLKGICEGGRFYLTITSRPEALIGVKVQYTVTAQLFYGDNSASITAGPRYSSNIVIEYP
jgi:hypothetical protein